MRILVGAQHKEPVCSPLRHPGGEVIGIQEAAKNSFLIFVNMLNK